MNDDGIAPVGADAHVPALADSQKRYIYSHVFDELISDPEDYRVQ